MSSKIAQSAKPIKHSPIGFSAERNVIYALLGVLAIFCVANFEMVSGMMQKTEGWRRTTHGWEYANALDSTELIDSQSKATREFISFEPTEAMNRSSEKKARELLVARQLRLMRDGFSMLTHLHFCLLATALATFMASMSTWFLVAMPNQSIVSIRS